MSAATLTLQLERLNALLAQVWHRNPFYTAKWRAAGAPEPPLKSLNDFERYPFTTREELAADQHAHPPLGTNLTFPLPSYKRFHRSSGTTRDPLVWADTPESWSWVVECSRSLFAIAGVTAEDRLCFTAPLSNTSGPWIMLAGAQALGCGWFTVGGAAPQEQLEWMLRLRPTVLVGKADHLLVLANAAAQANANLTGTGIRQLIVPGPPSIEAGDMRASLETRWRVPCLDRYGCTEAGSIASACSAGAGGMHLLETEFIREVIPSESATASHEPPARAEPRPGQAARQHRPASAGDGFGELVLTNLGRIARPIIRYRTGDLTRIVEQQCACGRTGAVLIGGIRRK